MKRSMKRDMKQKMEENMKRDTKRPCRFVTWYLNLSLLKKLVFGYILLIIIPLVGTCIFLNRLFYKNSIESFDLIQKNALEQVKGNLDVKVSQIEYIYNLLQYNRDMVDIMVGYYQDNNDEDYVYQNRLNDLFTYVKSSDESIASLTVYKSAPQIHSLGEDIMGMEMGLNEIYNSIRGGVGVWHISVNHPGISLLKYYKKIYDAGFTQAIGLMEISVSCEKLFSVLQPAENDGTNIYVYVSENDRMLIKKETFALSNTWQNKLHLAYEKMFQGTVAANVNTNKHTNTETNINTAANKNVNTNPDKSTDIADVADINPKGFLINGFAHENLGIYVLAVTDLKRAAAIKSQTAMMAAIILPLLAALTLIYYFTFSTFINLVRRFAHHIKSGGNNEPDIFTGKVYRDELGLLVDSYNLMVTRVNDLIINVHKAQLQQKEAAFQALQAQINPHFMHNTLETIRMMAEIGEVQKVTEMIQRLGSLLRYSLSKEDKKIVLKNETDYLINYLDIYKIRMGDRLTYTLEIGTDITEIQCPKFILQPLVENCVLHGTSALRRKGMIHIAITKTDDDVIIKISDNGAGIQPTILEQLKDRLEKGIERETHDSGGEDYHGIGITNVNARIRAYYGGASGVSVTSVLHEGTTYTITLNMKRVQT